MDSSTLFIILFLILAAVVLVGFFLYRGSTDAEITGPGGFRMRFMGKGRKDAAPPPAPAPGVKAKNVTAGRDAGFHDETGRGTDVEDIKAERDVGVTSKPPRDDDPKAPPPA
jgi:hypothetical protein